MFKFNFMDCQDIDTKFSIAQEWDFGMFRMADNLLETEFSNNFAYKNKKSEKIRKGR